MVERGAAFLVDVLHQADGYLVPTDGPVVGVEGAVGVLEPVRIVIVDHGLGTEAAQPRRAARGRGSGDVQPGPGRELDDEHAGASRTARDEQPVAGCQLDGLERLSGREPAHRECGRGGGGQVDAASGDLQAILLVRWPRSRTRGAPGGPMTPATTA